MIYIATIKENVYRAIKDFNSIKDTIEINGVEVNNTPTEQYGDLIEQLLEKNKTLLYSIMDRTITEITIPADVINIGKYAFAECSNLTTINFEPSDQRRNLQEGSFLKSGVTNLDLTNIYIVGPGVFQECNNLKELIILEGRFIEQGAFLNCKNLEKLTVQKNTVLRNYAFRGCTGLKSLILEEGTTAITLGVFYSCTGLETLTFPESFTELGASAFEACTSLKTVQLSSQHKLISRSTFYNCTSLQSINLPATLTTIGQYAFTNCSSLEFIEMETGFNANGLDISASTKFSVDTLVNILEALADRTGDVAYGLVIGTANLDKLTDEQKNIALNKNWILA